MCNINKYAYVQQLECLIQNDANERAFCNLIEREILRKIVSPEQIVREACLLRRGYGPDFVIKNNDRKVVGIIEVKKPNSPEFKVEVENETVKLTSSGVLPKFENFLQEKEAYPNKQGDGIGQIRGYYYVALYENLLVENSFAALTNGYHCLIFEFRKPENWRNKLQLLKLVKEPLNLNELQIQPLDPMLYSELDSSIDRVFYCSLPEQVCDLMDYIHLRLGT